MGEMIERLADIEHERWSHWMKYLFSKSIKNENGSVTIPKEFVERWERQLNTSYNNLSESEKESDRCEVRKYLIVHPLKDENE